MRNIPLLLATLTAGSALGVVATPRDAQACGGTFCDAGPTSMPVDQTGENILFVMGEGFTEAHIQIQYDPDAEAAEFAWVIPLTALPDFSVGSQPLFDQVLSGTVPSYGFTTQNNCGSGASGTGGDGGGGTTGADPGGSTGDGPEVVLQEVVGAFEITVLSGGTAAELVQWLDDNGYAQDPEAEPIIEEYLAEGYLFAAFRLINDAEVAEIHPVVLSFPVEEACVPLRLTRIAAVEDMRVRSFFLADARVVPETYRHVLVNPLKLDWPNLAGNYSEVVTLAVDAESADGRAFVTEYAGTSEVVSRQGVHDEAWDAEAYRLATAVEAIDLLQAQLLMSCYDDFGTLVCAYGHPLLPNLVQQYLPVPAGVEEAEFYDCPECFEALIDPLVWDGDAFADLLDERIVVPGQHAVTLLDAYPMLTRMFTTISPGEMTADPFFHENADLPEVDLTNQLALRQLECSDEVWILPDGREVYVPGGVWPAFDDEMPWEEEVQEIAAAGGPITLVTRTAEIDEQLRVHNCMFDYPSPEACGNGAVDDTAGSDTSGGTVGGGTGDDPPDFPGGSSGSSSAGQDDDTATGCGCRTQDPAGAGAMLLGFGLLGLGRRSRRRR
jgi:MYXO-CTERM domain-containing protein